LGAFFQVLLSISSFNHLEKHQQIHYESQLLYKQQSSDNEKYKSHMGSTGSGGIGCGGYGEWSWKWS
jgi:hypothetical protein